MAYSALLRCFAVSFIGGGSCPLLERLTRNIFDLAAAYSDIR
jgi:hypothetical protein